MIGDEKRVDLALPSQTPIGEYVADLAGLCGQRGGAVMPPAWSLAPAGGEPWSIELSLAEAGVADGQVLYLRDSAQDPGMTPVVEDIEELVAQESKERRTTTGHRGVLVVWLGAAWITLAAAVLGLRPPGGGLVAAIGLVLVAIVMLSLAWALNQRRTRLPATACLAISLCAVPCLAAAGGVVGTMFGTAPGGQLFWCGVVVGANVGMAMALGATPGPAVLAAEVPFAVAGAVAVVLAVLGANGTQTAAAAAVAALAMVAAARPLAGLVAAWSARMPKDAAGVAPATTQLMRHAEQLLTLILVFPAVALVAALPALALSGNPWALGLAAAGGLALVARARQVGFASEVVPVGAAGAVGLFAVVGTSAYRYLNMDAAVWTLVLVGGLVVGAGVTVAVLYRPPREDEQASFGQVLDTRDRGRFVEVIGMVCLIVSAALAMGVFGVFDDMVAMGRGIVG
ncbi:EsaB/YukD family protein [Fodinicola feengrottensis]|uniref:EsaB/YukD family protein n=1 Tax=Fodinicola feengrottensis TaxID=435914 RepID=UPI0031D0CA4A